MVIRTDNPFRDLCFSIACNETIFSPFIRICACLREDEFDEQVVCYDLYALGIWRVGNIRKRQILNKRSREKVFIPCVSCTVCSRDLPRGSWVLPTPVFCFLGFGVVWVFVFVFFCRLIGSSSYG